MYLDVCMQQNYTVIWHNLERNINRYVQKSSHMIMWKQVVNSLDIIPRAKQISVKTNLAFHYPWKTKIKGSFNQGSIIKSFKDGHHIYKSFLIRKWPPLPRQGKHN